MLAGGVTERPGAAGRKGLTGFLALFGMATSGLFGIGILLLAIAPLALGCAAVP